ncbi:MAG: transketolase [Ruminococcus sp.]|nr:transketolase [Ruminococcus sp.]
MPLSKQEWLALEKKAYELRKLCLQTTAWAGSGHIGGGMSVMDLLTVLYHKYLNVKVEDPKWEDRDRFILSKGHAAVAYAPVLCDKGFNDPEQLKTFNLSGSKMGMHLDSNKVVGVDASTGSLGHGVSIAAGTALAARVLGKDYLTYVVTGDGELGEGSNWEGFMTLNHYQCSNCIVFVDRNHCMIDGPTEDVMKLEPLADKFTAFGFNTVVIDGNNISELCSAIDGAIERSKAPCAPTCIIMDTKKGAGIKSIAGDYLWHYGGIDDALFEKFNKDLDEDYAERVARAEKEGK